MYAVKAGADIINCSWGTYEDHKVAKELFQYVIDQGCIVVAAAGNDGLDRKFYPAAYSGVLAVGSTNSNDKVSYFSNYGNWVSVMAPGNNIRSTLPPSTYGAMNGTSMASPIVAGLAGLMKAYYPRITIKEVATCITSTADSVEDLNSSKYSRKIGTGRINAYQAMRCVASLNGGITGIEKMEQELERSGLLIYPNPASHEILLASALSDKNGVQISLTDLSGRCVWQTEQTAGQNKGSKTIYKLALPSLAPGMYQVTLQSGKDQVTGKVILK
jgi:subtilisin family serine protease